MLRKIPLSTLYWETGVHPYLHFDHHVALHLHSTPAFARLQHCLFANRSSTCHPLAKASRGALLS